MEHRPTTRIPAPPLVSRGAGLSHRGLVRQRNEDAILTDPSGSLWAVADGMGGYGDGDVASDIVIERLARIVDGGAPGPALAEALQEANARIFALWRGGRERMGATVVALLASADRAHVAWAGDSRAWLWRDGRLAALTRDHSVVGEMIAAGQLSPQQAAHHADAHVVTRAVGAAEVLEVDRVVCALEPGDRLLLSSDGLHGVVPEAVIAGHLGAAAAPEDACEALVGASLERGAPDNVSVVVVFVGAG